MTGRKAVDTPMVTDLKALACTPRLDIISLLAKHPEGIAVGDLADAIGLSQPTVSHHLRLLRNAGVVVPLADYTPGHTRPYLLVRSRLERLGKAIGGLA